jgi:REP element-mobilizing transposase RayT
MARSLRRDGPGLYHHVTFRGVAGCEIFRDDVDRSALLARLNALVEELGFECLAWAFMPNHVHLVLRAGAIPLRRLMARLGTSYAMYFNRRHGRSGHLFQNRYWSDEIVEEAQLETVISYVEQNPLKAGMVAEERALADFAWSSYGKTKRGERRFHGGTRAEADAALLPAASCGASGSESELDALIAEACAVWRLGRATLCSGGRFRAVSEAREWVILRAVRELGLVPARVAAALGVGRAAVSRTLSRRAS